MGYSGAIAGKAYPAARFAINILQVTGWWRAAPVRDLASRPPRRASRWRVEDMTIRGFTPKTRTGDGRARRRPHAHGGLIPRVLELDSWTRGPARPRARSEARIACVARERPSVILNDRWYESVSPFPPKSNPRPRRGAYCVIFALTSSRIRMDWPIFPISPC